MSNGITINTDASYCGRTGTSGYAFWIVSGGSKITKGGIFMKTSPKNCIEAETMCIGNAIATLLASEMVTGADWVVLNSDCVPAMDNIRAGRRALGKQVLKLWKRLQQKTGAAKMEMRHVRAHTVTGDRRSYVNAWCDAEAKKWRLEAVRAKREAYNNNSNKETINTAKILRERKK